MNIAKVLPKFSTLKLLNCVPKYHPGLFLENQRCLSIMKQNVSILSAQNINSSNVIQKRFKKKISGKQNKTGTNKRREMEEKDNEEEDDDDEEGGEDKNPDNEIIHTTTPALDVIVCGKYIFNISRHLYEENFQKNLIRVNGERVSKNHKIQTGDEIDLIRGINLEDRSKVDVRRIVMQSIDDKAASSGRIRISFKRINKLTIDNYTVDPVEF